MFKLIKTRNDGCTVESDDDGTDEPSMGVARIGSGVLGSRVGFNVPLLIIGHIGNDFYGSDDPTNNVKALKDNSWSVHQ